MAQRSSIPRSRCLSHTHTHSLAALRAGRWQPEVAEFFRLDRGNRTTKGTGDAAAADGASYEIAIAADGNVAVATKSVDGVFNATLYRWDMASKRTRPDWVYTKPGHLFIQVAVSDDGSTVVASARAWSAPRLCMGPGDVRVLTRGRASRAC